MIFFLLFLGLNAGRAGEIHLNPRPLPARADECKLCHVKKQLRYVPEKHAPQKEHKDHPLTHGKQELSCNSCHDAGNANQLRSAPGFEANFRFPSPVCQRCHSEVFRDWQQGMHGKRSGGWNKDQVSSHCIDCHDPHSVMIKPVFPKPAPVRPKLGVEKHH